MSAARLREAARLMRERAKAAVPGPWVQTGEMGSEWNDIVDAPEADYNGVIADTDTHDANADHIASWHPAVALAVADLLDAADRNYPEFPEDADYWDFYQQAIDLANAYLGGAS